MAFTKIVDATMLSRARTWLNEPSALSFTDAEITGWLDRGANYLMHDSKCVEVGSTTLTLVDGTPTYAFTTPFTAAENCIEIETIFYTGAADGTAQPGKCLEKVDPRHLATLPHTGATDPVAAWYLIGTTIGIFPTPTTTNGCATKKCLILWYRNYDTYDDGSTGVYVPDHMCEVPLFYVMAQANLKLKRYAVANMFMAMFMDFVMFYRQDYLPKPVDSRDMWTVPDYTKIA